MRKASSKFVSSLIEIGAGAAGGFCAMLLALALMLAFIPASHARQLEQPASSAAEKDRGVSEAVPNAVTQFANQVTSSSDNQSLEFFILDKKNASIHAFDGGGRLRESSPILIGAAIGDDSVQGIGNRPINKIRPHERTTPAGRFVGERGRNASGEDIVWVDYDAAISMHRVRATKTSERRLQRLASKTNGDNRISYGCINVPTKFYEAHIVPVFAHSRAVIYVLPEVKPINTVFSFIANDQPAVAGMANAGN
jgi:hypothetical protein